MFFSMSGDVARPTFFELLAADRLMPSLQVFTPPLPPLSRPLYSQIAILIMRPPNSSVSLNEQYTSLFWRCCAL